jgi:hypothetical protein
MLAQPHRAQVLTFFFFSSYVAMLAQRHSAQVLSFVSVFWRSEKHLKTEYLLHTYKHKGGGDGGGRIR